MEYFRNFVFTINNYTDVDIQHLLSYDCRYMLFAREVAPTTGTLHLQGYCELNKRMRFAALKFSLPAGTHIEARYGTQKQAIDYIKAPTAKSIPESEDVYEVGEPRTMGTEVGPSSLDKARQLLTDKVQLNSQIHDIGTIKAYEKLKKYWPIGRSHRNGELSRIWIYGPGRSGKTSRAYDLCSGLSTFKCDTAHKGWFDGYDNHEAVILDDYEPDPDDSKAFKVLLSLLDVYPLRVEVKGSTTQWDPKTIVITSQHPPWHYYGSPYECGQHINMDLSSKEYWARNVQLRQLMGRIDKLIEMNKDATEVRFPNKEISKG